MQLIDFIRNNDNWEEKLKEKFVRMKKDGRLMIFNYLPGADFSDPLVRECRGVILDDALNVVCRGFDKFGNYSEPYAAEIDWEHAVVQKKYDGSICKLYWWNGAWNWATNSVIHAADAPIEGFGNFQNLINEADNLPDLGILDKRFTYIFELVSPHNQIVIRYPRTHLYHIGTRKNDPSGEEIIANIWIEKPPIYGLKTLDGCLETVKQLNEDEVTDEGFVVCDRHFNRIKIKAPEYFELHRDRFLKLNSEKIVTMLLEQPLYEKVIEEFPQFAVEIAWYEYQLQRFFRGKKEMETKAVRLYEEYEGNRKLVAEEIKDDPFSYYGFMAINGNPVEHVAWKDVRKFVKEYTDE